MGHHWPSAACLTSVHFACVQSDISAYCSLMLTAPLPGLQGPEIRTGFLKNPDQPVKLTAGKEIMITTDYEHKGDEEMFACR